MQCSLNNHPVINEFARSIYRYFYGLHFLILLIAGHIPSHIVRCAIYRLFGLKIGENSYIYGKAEIRAPHQICIGENTIIGHSAILDGRGGLSIGNNVNFSSGVWIWSVEHIVNDRSFGSVSEKVIIEDYVWISCRTVILPGVKIGYGAVVCAGAVVTKNVEPYSIVGGVPARKIGERRKDLKYSLGDPTPFI